MKLFVVKFRRIFDVFALRALYKMFWTHFHDLCVQKRSCLLWNWDAFWKFSACKFCRKSSGRNSTICASKNEAVCREIQTHFESFLLASFTEKVVGAIPQYVRPKIKLFAMKCWRLSKVLFLQVLQKKLWAQFHDLCVQKWSCVLWSSDAFWKFLPCKLYKKSSGHIFPIYASKNEAVCCEVQTHFGSSLPASFTEKVLGAIPRFVHPKTKLFAVKFWRILEVLFLQVLKTKFWAQFHDLCVQKRSGLLWSSDAFWMLLPLKIYKKNSGHIFPIYASRNEAVCRGVQTHFASSLPASFTDKVLGAIPRFVRPKTKMFAMKFRRIL